MTFKGIRKLIVLARVELKRWTVGSDWIMKEVKPEGADRLGRNGER